MARAAEPASHPFKAHPFKAHPFKGVRLPADPIGMPAVITEQRSFGLDKAHARHCPLCDVGWDGRYQDACWLEPTHPAVPGAPPLVQFLTVPLPTDPARPAYATELDPVHH